MSDEGSILERLGVGRVINGFGAITLLGASSMSPRVRRAVEEANDTYVAIHELRDRAGDVIASILGSTVLTPFLGHTWSTMGNHNVHNPERWASVRFVDEPV